MRKNKFKPRVSKIKLSPEQAVLACACYNTARLPASHFMSNPVSNVCSAVNPRRMAGWACSIASPGYTAVS